MPKQKRNFIIYFFGGLVVILVLVWSAVFSQTGQAQDGLLEVTFFDVGQGDAIFIETPGGRQILIDGGPDNSVLRKLAEEMPFYDRSIDIVIATHPDADHITGLIDVLEKYDVGLVIDSGDFKGTGVFQEYSSVLKDKNYRYKKAIVGDKIKIGEDIILEILNPGEELYEKSNNNSVVIRMDYSDASFLFTGDAERLVEHRLIQGGWDIDVDVMQVAHHGSKTSSSQLFLENVSPDLAVISVGENNRYRHPFPAVLENLDKYGIKVLRTDTDGDIGFVSDGEEIIVQ